MVTRTSLGTTSVTHDFSSIHLRNEEFQQGWINSIGVWHCVTTVLGDQPLLWWCAQQWAVRLSRLMQSRYTVSTPWSLSLTGLSPLTCHWRRQLSWQDPADCLPSVPWVCGACKTEANISILLYSGISLSPLITEEKYPKQSFTLAVTMCWFPYLPWPSNISRIR